MTGGQHYRLQALLAVRQREEDGKKIELANAVRATQLARQREEQAKQAVHDAKARRTRAQEKRTAKLDAGESTARDLTTSQQFDRRLMQAIDEANANVSAAARLVSDALKFEDEAREELAEAAQARQAIEKHKEKWDAEKKRERERREEAEADDLANRRS